MTDWITTFLEPLGWFLDPAQSVYWPYLLSAAALAALVWWTTPGARRRGLCSFLFSRRIWLHRSCLADLRFWLVDAALSGTFLVPLLLSSESVADLVYEAAFEGFGDGLPVQQAGLAATLLFTVVVVMASDGSFFVSHWLRHRIPFLWEFHKIHHSAEVMTPFTTFRSHPVDQLISGTLAGVAIGIVVGAFDFVYAGEHQMINVWGANALVFASNLVGGPLRHSHVPLRYGSWLDRVVISPAHHQLHHSTDPAHWNRNFGGIFAFWDALAGTLVVPEAGRRLRFGIGDGSDARYHGVLRMYLLPLLEIVRRAVRGGSRGSKGVSPERPLADLPDACLG